MAGTPHERTLAAEMVLVMFVQTTDALSGSSSGKFSLPDPSRYFATLIVFTMLSGAAMFGEKAGRLAATFGGVATLAILLAPTRASSKAGKPQPLIMSMLNYFNQVMSGGTQGVTGGGSTTFTPGNLGAQAGSAVAAGGADLAKRQAASGQSSSTWITPTILKP